MAKRESMKILRGLIRQITLLFLLSILVTGMLADFGQRILGDINTKQQMEERAADMAGEVRMAVEEYPAHAWLLQYWASHAEEMDVEYDVDYVTGTKTREKAEYLVKHYPGVPLQYLSTETVEALPEEDQKLYAEVIYSWFITRINEIKRANGVDYLFGVLAKEPFKEQFYLFSAADADAVRGTQYEQVYPLGTRAPVSDFVTLAMRYASKNVEHLADAGKYLDYYSSLGMVEDQYLLVGITYSVPAVTERARNVARQGTFFAMIHQLILASLLLSLLYFVLIKPLKQVQKSIRAYKESKESEEVIRTLQTVHPNNEIGQLSEDVMEMTQELDDHIHRMESITAERARIGTELGLATNIQLGMLPSTYPAFPDRKDFDIFGLMDPAREVGGDFYNYFLVDDDHLCFLIADVSGKGIPASLVMMAMQITLGVGARQGKSPAEILEEANNTLCARNNTEMFVTVWLGILELSTGKLMASNAGHEYPALCPPGGRFELVKNKHSFVVGGMEDMTYHEYTLQLAPGARLFLYTDGVPEATDAQQQMFGTDRMLDALNEGTNDSPEGVIERMRQRVDDFVQEAEQFDDLTMLCLEYRGCDGRTQ